MPEGPILVPCCGTFPELDSLIPRFPDREIVGIDLSAGMVRRARERAARWPRVSVVEGDASTLDPSWSGRCGAVVSVFGFQQLPEVVRAHVPAGDGSWEHGLVAALASQGATVERDERPSHPMSHPDAPTFFDAYTRSGSLRALALARGDAFVDQLRGEFLRRARLVVGTL